MKLIISENYRAYCDSSLLGYQGETNARTIKVVQPHIDEATAYRLIFDCGNDVIYEVDVTDGEYIVDGGLLINIGTVKCQWQAVKLVGGTYELVAKSNIIELEVKPSIQGNVAPIPTYEQSKSALDEVLQAAEQAQGAEAAAHRAETAAGTATEAAEVAEQAKTEAVNAAVIAAQKATEAEQSAIAAAESATAAGQAKTAAETAASNANQSAETASAKAGEATQAATQAAESAQTAADKASEIAASAEQIAENTENISQLDVEKVNKNGTSEITPKNCEFFYVSPQIVDKEKIIENEKYTGVDVSAPTENRMALYSGSVTANQKYRINVVNRKTYYGMEISFYDNEKRAILNTNSLNSDIVTTNADNTSTIFVPISINVNDKDYTPAYMTVTLWVTRLLLDGVDERDHQVIIDNVIMTENDSWDGKYHEFGKAEIKTEYMPVTYFSNSENNTLILCRGDSLTAGAGAGESDYKYTSVLQNLITDGKRVAYFAVGGETAEKIAARMGAIPITLEPFVLPETTKTVQVFTRDWCGKSLTFYGNAGVNPCYIDGIECTFSASGGAMYIKRNETGNQIQFERPVQLITNDYINYRNTIAVIWVGTNNSSDSVEDIINVQKLIVENLKNDKYIIVGLTCQTEKYRLDIPDVNKEMSKIWGNHFLDLYSYILEYGLADENIEPTEADVAALSKGEIPPSLIYQDDGYNVHFNRYGYDIVGKQIYQKGVSLGYWK